MMTILSRSSLLIFCKLDLLVLYLPSGIAPLGGVYLICKVIFYFSIGVYGSSSLGSKRIGSNCPLLGRLKVSPVCATISCFSVAGFLQMSVALPI